MEVPECEGIFIFFEKNKNFKQMKRRYFLLIIFAILVSNIHAQELDSDIPKIFYRNEKTVSLNFATNGWGLGYRYGSRINFFEKKLYEFDLTFVKHPKEIKTTSTFLSSESFVFGKLNSVYDLRFGYGRQNKLYGKTEKGSIGVQYFYTFGPSIAIRKPIYYEIISVSDTIGYTIEKFDPSIHTSGSINSKASFFKGIDEISLVPSVFIKAGINFEFGKKETTIHAIEVGGMLQAYLKDLEIMAVDDNQQFYISLFACYRIGKIVNAQEISEEYLKKRKKRFRLF